MRKPEIVERFRKEAFVLGKLNHPNIAILYNFIHHGNRYYMVMEFAPGGTPRLDHRASPAGYAMETLP
ncbi:MAG: protein kinase [Gammaproteobacteria bacterium]